MRSSVIRVKKSILVLGLLAQVSAQAKLSMNNEKCWTTKPMMSVKDSKKIADEQALCEMDFYTGDLTACPKLNSTYPGVLVVKRLTDISDSEFKAKYCLKIEELKDNEDNGGGKKPFSVVAKLKQTASCSHASSPVAYYRVAEFLGGIRVPYQGYFSRKLYLDNLCRTPARCRGVVHRKFGYTSMA